MRTGKGNIRLNNRDTIQGLVVMLFAIVYFIKSLELPLPFAVPGQPGPAFYPWCLAAVLFVCGIALLRNGLVQGQEDNNNKFVMGKEAIRPALTILVTVVFLKLFATAGFWVSTVVYACSIVFAFEYGRRKAGKALTLSLVAGILVTAAVYFLFEVLLAVRLPRFKSFW
ncbi:MAG: tripartite tricarboxylate transporter TctB family protein [bacterium]|jgi:putative tricarboxylic transport membrane protein